jgi:hypothetical protein
LRSPRESTVSKSQLPKGIDYSVLYEELGNIIIERAHAGDEVCQSIYVRAWQKARDNRYKKEFSATGMGSIPDNE